MGKLIMTVAIDFDEVDESLNLSLSTDVDGEMDNIEAATALFFKKAIEVYAEHAANQSVDYGGIVRALVHSTEGNDWED